MSEKSEYLHSWHYDMLINEDRSQFYNDLIKAHCKDKIVLEIGTGAGLLAALAIKHGARQVICCEENEDLAKVAEALFARLGIQDKILFIKKNSKNIQTSEIPAADVLLHELYGSDPFNEEFIPTLRDARRFLRPDAIILPEAIQIVYRPIKTKELKAKIEFEGIELKEISELLGRVHPSLRKRTAEDSESYRLPVQSMMSFVETNYNYKETNKALVGADSLEVSFNIIHGKNEFQAAKFEEVLGSIHWFPLYFYKLDVDADNINFFVKDETTLLTV